MLEVLHRGRARSAGPGAGAGRAGEEGAERHALSGEEMQAVVARCVTERDAGARVMHAESHSSPAPVCE